MIEKGFQILVGDGNGADKAIQRYLAEKSYPNVLVHCMKDHCRNNVGNWPTREIDAPRGVRGFDYYSLKDRAMTRKDFGFSLHGDGLLRSGPLDGSLDRRIAERHLRNNSRIVRWPFLLVHAIGRAHSGASASTGSAPRSRNSLTSSGRCHRQAQPSGVLSSK